MKPIASFVVKRLCPPAQLFVGYEMKRCSPEMSLYQRWLLELSAMKEMFCIYAVYLNSH